jgi:hypothetical protein
MEFKELHIERNERKSQSRSSRITNFFIGLVWASLVLLVDHFKQPISLSIGILIMIYGLVGLEFFKTVYSIKVTHHSLEIIKSYRPDIFLDLKLVEYISLRNNELQVHYSDYVKTYNLPWLTGEDYHELKEKVFEICSEKTGL